MLKTLDDAMNTSPNDVRDGDAFAAQVVAVAGFNGDWAMYIGPSAWSAQEVQHRGRKLCKDEIPFAYLMCLRKYRR